MTIKLEQADKLTGIEFYAKVASTAFAFNDLVYLDANGLLALATTSAILPLGVVQKTVASTDSDYASNTRIPVLVPGPDATFRCDVGTGTAATTDIGEWIDVDDEKLVDVDASTNDIFYVTKIISTSVVIAKMARKSGAAA